VPQTSSSTSTPSRRFTRGSPGQEPFRKRLALLGASEVLHTVPAGLVVCHLEGRYALRAIALPCKSPTAREAPSAPPLPQAALAGEACPAPARGRRPAAFHASKLPEALRRYGEAWRLCPLCTRRSSSPAWPTILGGDQQRAVSRASALYLQPGPVAGAFYWP